MLIKVTQKHIDSGVKCSRSECPIALAALDLGVKYVNVGYTKIILDNKIYKLPETATDFIFNFDVPNPNVSPLDFEVSHGHIWKVEE